MKQEEITIIRSSGNVFADMGLEDAEELLADADRRIAARKAADLARQDHPSIIVRLFGYVERGFGRKGRHPCTP